MYIVGGTSSRTLSYLASRRMPTISICPACSTFDPMCWPMGFSFAKYLRAAVSLMIATFGAFESSRSVNVRPTRIGISIVSKNPGEMSRRLIESRWSRA
jgi:hypothetical protein